MNGNRASCALISGMLVALVLLLSYAPLAAQNNTAAHQVFLRVTSVSSVALSDTNPITLNIQVDANTSVPTTTGEVDTTKRLWYTSVNPPGSSRTIMVKMTEPPPAGTILRVAALEVKQGQGTAVAGGVVLDGTDRAIITSIPSCATGRSSDDGALLRYSFESEAGQIPAADSSSTAMIIYTISDS